MSAKPGTVELYFTDRDGVRWRIYEFAWVNFKPKAVAIGTVDGTYRGFERLDGVTELRAHMVVRREESALARVLSGAELQRELDASTPWPAVGDGKMPVPRRAPSDRLPPSATRPT